MTPWILLSALLLQLPVPRIEGGVVTGTVRRPDGTPAAGVRVAAMPTDASPTAGNGSTLVALAQADPSGQFRLEDVPPGRYYIIAGRVDAPTFYPGVQDVGSGRVITVTSGATTDGIDFSATPESLRPVAPRGRGVSANLNQTLQQMMDSLNRVNLPRPAPSVPVNVRVILHEDSKNSNLPRLLTLQVQRSGSTINNTLQIGPAGRFTAQLQPGESRLFISGLPQGYSVTSMTSGTTDLLAGPVVVDQGMPEIVIVVSFAQRI